MKWRKAAVSSIVAAAILIAPVQSIVAETETDNHIDTLVEAYKELLQHYSKPDQEELMEAAIQGMIEAIGDPYTNYMPAEEYDSFMNAINQNYAGIGIVAVADEDRKGLEVVEVFPNTPAAQSGLSVGDLIVKVDGISPVPGKVQELNQYIRGKEGTKVSLQIVRGGKQLTISPTRQQIQIPLVKRTDMGSGIHMISISSFGAHTLEEFQTAYDEAVAANAKGIILDLRGNGGGLVDSALTIADMFFKKGTLLIAHDEAGNDQLVEADPEGTDIPMAVIIDGGSASASEMLAGALQRNNRARLIGETSFGKGTMQAPYELPNGAVVKVSIERWELPDGSVIDQKGIRPDIRLSNPALFVNAAVQALVPGRAQQLSLSRTNGSSILNGIELPETPQPIARNGKVYLPVRFVAEAFGSEVHWAGGVTSFKLGGRQIRVTKSNDLITADGMAYIASDSLARLIGKPVTVSKASVTIKL